MTTAHPEKKYSNFIIVLLLLFPVAINSVKVFGNLILLILVVLGVYIAISEKKNPFKLPELKLFSQLTVGYFLVMLLSILIADGFGAELHHLGRKIHFLFAPFIALAIFQVDLSLKKLLLSIKIGLIAIGTIAITGPLLGSSINANIFSDIAVAMLFLSIIQVFSETPKERVITFIAVLMGGYAIFLIGARGSWLSFLILSIVYIGLIYKPFIQNNNKVKISLMLIFVVFLGFVSTSSNIKERVIKSITEVQDWNSGKEIWSSNGNRMKMWKSGLSAAKGSPWFGYGYRNENKTAAVYVSKNKDWVSVATHLHNQYITNLVSAGVIGLLSLLTLLFAPIVVFYRKLKDKGTYYYSAMGILLCVGYITFGFTHIAFGEEHINAFYVLFMGFLLPKVTKQ
jgi:O-antigen ligase